MKWKMNLKSNHSIYLLQQITKEISHRGNWKTTKTCNYSLKLKWERLVKEWNWSLIQGRLGSGCKQWTVRIVGDMQNLTHRNHQHVIKLIAHKVYITVLDTSAVILQLKMSASRSRILAHLMISRMNAKMFVSRISQQSSSHTTKAWKHCKRMV